MITPEPTKRDLHKALEDAVLLMKVLDIRSIDELDLALLLRLYRARKNLKLESIAQEIGVTRHLLSEIENGKIPQRAKLVLICDYFGEGFTSGVRLLGLL